MDIRAHLAKGGSMLGTWVGMNNTVSAEIIAKAGYDFVIIDTQHGAVFPEDLLILLQLFDAHNVPPLVRVTWTDQPEIMRALDMGAAGVVVPMVSTPEQAKLAAEACRYPPRGTRSFGPVRSYYSTEGVVADPLCLVMCETKEGHENIDAIAATPGVDGVLVGPVDLALSYGYSTQEAFTAPQPILDATSDVVAACRKHNKISASAALGLPNGKELVRRGVQMVGVNADSFHIRLGVAADLKEMRSWQA